MSSTFSLFCYSFRLPFLHNNIVLNNVNANKLVYNRFEYFQQNNSIM